MDVISDPTNPMEQLSEQVEKDPGILKKVLTDLFNVQYNPLEQNGENVLEEDLYKKLKKEIRERSKFKPEHGINPPLLILIAGTTLTGKSTLAEFMKQHLDPEGVKGEQEDMDIDTARGQIRMLSTERVIDVICQYIPKDKEPILHALPYKCDTLVTTEKKYLHQNDIVNGYQLQS